MKIIPCNTTEFNTLEAKIYPAIVASDPLFKGDNWCKPDIVNSVTGKIAYIVEKSVDKDAVILGKLTQVEKDKIIDIQSTDTDWFPSFP